MAYAAYAPFQYGPTTGQHQPPPQANNNPYFNFPKTNYNPYPPFASSATPRYAQPQNGYHGTPYASAVPFPGAHGAYGGGNGTPFPAAPVNFPDTSPPPFIPPPITEQEKHHGSTSKKSHSGRVRTNSSPSAATAPIKSAMKRSSTINPPPTTATTAEGRKRTPSFGSKQHGNGTPPLSRTRTKSDVKASLYDMAAEMDRFESNYMFVSFQGSSEFVVEFATNAAMKEIRAHLQRIWKEGVEDEPRKGPHLHLKFRGTPWNMSGPHKEQAWDMIVTIFRIFALRGYGLSSIINLGYPPSKLVFCKQPRDNSTGFFLVFFSKNGFRVNLIRPPQAIDQVVVSQLTKAFSGFIERNEMVDHIRCIELSREAQKRSRKILDSSVKEYTVDPTYFLMRVLNAISDIRTYRLECTLPLSPSGWPTTSRTSEVGSHKEIYVFGGMEPT